MHLPSFAMRKFNYLLALLVTNVLSAQTVTPGLSVYAEAYFADDVFLSQVMSRPGFIYNFHRQNELALNLLQADFGHITKDGRGHMKLALMTGTYVERNLATEPDFLRPIAEAFVGFKAKNSDLWVDFGVFNSHIGFESVKGADNDMLSRTLMADNSPYYESGVRMLYNREKFMLGLFALNGWQQMRRTILPRCGPAAGTQLQWKAGLFTFNSSTFFGILSPLPYQTMRFYHNFWMSYVSQNEKHRFTFSADQGLNRRKYLNQIDLADWFVAAAVYRWNVNQHWSFSVRGEYFYDSNLAILPLINPLIRTATLLGAAGGAEYRINEDFRVRAEIRSLTADSPYFEGVTYNTATGNFNPFRTEKSLWTALSVSYRIPPILLQKQKND